MRNINSYPVDDQPRVAVERFHKIQGDFLFRKLLKYLKLSYSEFVEEYGMKLVDDPTCLSRVMVEMMSRR